MLVGVCVCTLLTYDFRHIRKAWEHALLIIIFNSNLSQINELCQGFFYNPTKLYNKFIDFFSSWYFKISIIFLNIFNSASGGISCLSILPPNIPGPSRFGLCFITVSVLVQYTHLYTGLVFVYDCKWTCTPPRFALRRLPLIIYWKAFAKYRIFTIQLNKWSVTDKVTKRIVIVFMKK